MSRSNYNQSSSYMTSHQPPSFYDTNAYWLPGSYEAESSRCGESRNAFNFNVTFTHCNLFSQGRLRPQSLGLHWESKFQVLCTQNFWGGENAGVKSYCLSTANSALATSVQPQVHNLHNRSTFILNLYLLYSAAYGTVFFQQIQFSADRLGVPPPPTRMYLSVSLLKLNNISICSAFFTTKQFLNTQTDRTWRQTNNIPPSDSNPCP
jgi:hypothetical protein